MFSKARFEMLYLLTWTHFISEVQRFSTSHCPLSKDDRLIKDWAKLRGRQLIGATRQLLLADHARAVASCLPALLVRGSQPSGLKFSLVPGF